MSRPPTTLAYLEIYLRELAIFIMSEKNIKKRSDVPKRGHLTVAIFSEILYNI